MSSSTILFLFIGFVVTLVLGLYSYVTYFRDNTFTTTDPVPVDEVKVKEEEIEISQDLKDVKGIGPAREKKLLDEFGTKRAVANADDEELAEIIPEQIIERLRKKIS